MGLLKKKEPYIEKKGITGECKDYHVYHMPLWERSLYMLIGGAVGFVVGWIFYESKMVSIIVGIICAFGFVPIRRDKIIEKRKNKLTMQFKDFLESLATSIGAGSNITDALLGAEKDMIVQYTNNSDIVKELKIINGGIRNNIGVEALLLDFADRSDIDDIRSFANVFDTCYRKGGDMSDVIKNTHQILSDKIEILLEIKTVVSGNKNQQNIMMVMPIMFVFLLKGFGNMIDMHSLKGTMATTIAIFMFAISYFIGKKILDIKI
ncbi:Flp pilus assembly protein TadB [Lachnospiraceae bacterium KM106-2]|nr:Flp pilus assembly protein TadB [Lachnospiraceae bacterium KM106-2]